MDVPTIIFIVCLAAFGIFMLWWAWTMLFDRPSLPPQPHEDLGQGIGHGADSSSFD